MKPSILLQYALPHRLLSRLMRALAHARWRPWKNFLIRTFAARYRIALEEAASANENDYPSFNAFFTRGLLTGARQAHGGPQDALVPADGTISQLGSIIDGALYQAKGFRFSLAELLADDQAAERYRTGCFATVYLSPRDYHRVHMPLPGTLLETAHVPGKLFSVAAHTVAAIPRLFARNERLVCHFDTPAGSMAVILVGAMLVSGIETVWGDIAVPPYAKTVDKKNYRAANPPIRLDRFAEMGRFNMGSTAIVLLPEGFRLNESLAAGACVKVGELLATPR